MISPRTSQGTCLGSVAYSTGCEEHRDVRETAFQHIETLFEVTLKTARGAKQCFLCGSKLVSGLEETETPESGTLGTPRSR